MYYACFSCILLIIDFNSSLKSLLGECQPSDSCHFVVSIAKWSSWWQDLITIKSCQEDPKAKRCLAFIQFTHCFEAQQLTPPYKGAGPFTHRSWPHPVSILDSCPADPYRVYAIINLGLWISSNCFDSTHTRSPGSGIIKDSMPSFSSRYSILLTLLEALALLEYACAATVVQDPRITLRTAA